MNARQALEISENSLPVVTDTEYNSIMRSVERATKMGKTDVLFGFTPPSKDVMKRLEHDGYWFYSFGDNWLCPKMYGISWKTKEPKRKWYTALFNIIKK